jgi:hypothetical protein
MPAYDDPFEVRRRQRAARSRRTLTLAIVGGAVGLCLAVVVGLTLLLSGRHRTTEANPADPGTRGVSGPGLFGPSASKEGESWNHDELAAYLTDHGVPALKVPTTRGRLAGPACFFCRDDHTHRKAVDGDKRMSLTVEGSAGTVYVQKESTAQTAKDSAGAATTPAFAWGRFSFQSTDTEYLNAMKRALGAK